MSSVRPGSPGATRACPHCREIILESAGVCPACRHYLRFDAREEASDVAAITPLRIEGSIRHPADGEPWEYTIVVTIRNDRGEEIARKLIGVGALNPNEQRTFALSVEAVWAKTKRPGKGGRMGDS
jgi:RNA polymerase subunit RPABC4/transcription elongation factor Spt4